LTSSLSQGVKKISAGFLSEGKPAVSLAAGYFKSRATIYTSAEELLEASGFRTETFLKVFLQASTY